MAAEWFQVRPGRATMVEFTNGDVKILKAGTVFKENSGSRSIQRLLRGKRPRLRKLTDSEVAYHGLGEALIVLLDESI